MHELELPSVFYRALLGGKLHFLLVEDGRRFVLHDVIRIVEVDRETRAQTGQFAFVQVTFVVADPALGLREGWACLSVKVKIQSSRMKIEQEKKA